MSKERLNQVGLKATLPRQQILTFLKNSTPNHKSVEEIFQNFEHQPDPLSLSTIYRVLNDFLKKGLVQKRSFDNGHQVFEYKDENEIHDHLICTECGNVNEFTQTNVQRIAEQVAKQSQFQLKDHSFNLYGVCKDCDEKKE